MMMSVMKWWLVFIWKILVIRVVFGFFMVGVPRVSILNFMWFCSRVVLIIRMLVGG